MYEHIRWLLQGHQAASFSVTEMLLGIVLPSVVAILVLLDNSTTFPLDPPLET